MATEIVFHGTGGQGAVVAVKLLADAVARSGRQVQSFSAYGLERRGGKVESFIRISEGSIKAHSKVYEPDYVIVMDDGLLKNRSIVANVKKDGAVLINSVKPPEAFSSLGSFKVTTIDAGAISTKHKLLLPSGTPVTNTIILGAFAGMTGLVSIEHLAEAIKEGDIPRTEVNIEAAKEAYATVKSKQAKSAKASVAAKAPVELRPAYKTRMPPCEASCPAGHVISKTISLIQKDRFEEALENIRTENPFPGICGQVCFHPCETGCNRVKYDEGIAINALEAAAFEYGNAGGKSPVKRQKTGKKVGVIGSGPAGLACAYFLSLLGHKVTIYEALPVLGGMLKAGIPKKRLPADIAETEIKRILDLGVEAKTGTVVGKDISFKDILQKYDACFIAIGAQRTASLGIPGKEILSLPAALEMDGELIKADYLGRTSVKGVFAGGDATLKNKKARSVSEAVGFAKRAAVGIDLFLKGADDSAVAGVSQGKTPAISMVKYLETGQAARDERAVQFSDLNLNYFEKLPRAKARQALPRAEAVAEAERCFQCGRCNLCENCYIFCPEPAISFDENKASFVINFDICKKCGVCIKECPRAALSWEGEAQ